MIQFTDILIGCPLPVHKYLSDHPYLSVRVIADGEVCGETSAVKGNPNTGIWGFESSLYVPESTQWLTLALISNVERIKTQYASSTFIMVEIRELFAEHSQGYHRFFIGESLSPTQLIMACSVKLAGPSIADEAGFNVMALQGDAINAMDNTISTLQRAVALMPDGHPDKAAKLDRLGNALEMRFRNNGVITDLENAILSLHKAVEITPDDHPDKPGRHSDLGAAFSRRFERIDAIADLDNAILSLKQAVALTPDGHPDKPRYQRSLGGGLRAHFQRTGVITGIDEAISSLRKAVDLTPDGHLHKPMELSNLGAAFQIRFKRLGSLEDIENAISALQKAVALTPEGHPDKPRYQSNLGITLQTRFESTGILTDIENAIASLRSAVELTLDGHPDKPGRLNNLGCTLQTRFERLGSLEDIKGALLSLQRAVELTPTGSLDKPLYQSNLGGALRAHFQHTGVITDIDSAIKNLQKAVEITPDSHLDKPHHQCGLGVALQTRFERLGHLADIENAIYNLQKAVEITPDGHPDKPRYQSNLGGVLRIRFERLGSLADIENAISNLQKAVEGTPDGHPDKPGRHSNLGGALSRRFERIDAIADLDNAISSLQQALALTPDGHPDKPGQYGNLGGALSRRFERLDTVVDLDNAISSLQQAVALTPNGHPDNPGRHSNLGSALSMRFNRIGTPADLENAILGLQRAVSLTPDGHPDKTTHLSNLGLSLTSRFNHQNALEDLENALQIFSRAARSTTGPATSRFNAALAWATTAEKNSRSSLDAYRCAIDLLPRIAWLGLAVTDQHALLADVGDVVRDAVEAAIRLKEYKTAIEWAEQGRSIVWQNLLGFRTPLESLRAAYPQLADRLQNVTFQLEGSPAAVVPGSTGVVPTADVARRYSELVTGWEDIVEEIRRLPKFGGFLKAKTFAELAPAAYEGPVVILNVHRSRCDALVLLTDTSILHVRLEHFSDESSKNLLQDLKRLLSSAGVRDRNPRKHEWVEPTTNGEPKFKRILRILWMDVVKPVMEGLEYQVQSSTSNSPRVWWCATGSLAFLPIHAAGLYNAGEIGENVSDYVVSSYTPTLTAILQPTVPIVPGDFQVLTVSQPSTPYATPIPKTDDEVKAVQRLAGNVRIVNLGNESATVQRVLRAMGESTWIHLACHGQQRVDDPMESGFLLHDRVMKLSEIVKVLLPKAEFAFLSACQTATGDEKVAEESVHLAAGMLFSGCRGVIATMWSIRDDDGPKIAEDVYRRILKDGSPNRKEAANALHDAVKCLRDSGSGFMAWVPFIHIGR